MIARKTSIILFFLFTAFFFELNAQTPDRQLIRLSDGLTDSVPYQATASNLISYDKAMQQWETVSDVNNWIRGNFRYDIERAKQLSENSSTREKTPIYSPDELYLAKKGVCIDLSRFAVETINLIDTSKHTQYLMIEFEPIVIDGSIIKKHWMAVYQNSSGYYFLADSKRPGHIAGSYENIDEFIKEYQTFRDRKIVDWKVLVSYEKKKMKKKIQQKQDLHNN